MSRLHGTDGGGPAGWVPAYDYWAPPCGLFSRSRMSDAPFIAAVLLVAVQRERQNV